MSSLWFIFYFKPYLQQKVLNISNRIAWFAWCHVRSLGQRNTTSLLFCQDGRSKQYKAPREICQSFLFPTKILFLHAQQKTQKSGSHWRSDVVTDTHLIKTKEDIFIFYYIFNPYNLQQWCCDWHAFNKNEGEYIYYIFNPYNLQHILINNQEDQEVFLLFIISIMAQSERRLDWKLSTNQITSKWLQSSGLWGFESVKSRTLYLNIYLVKWHVC